MHLQMQGNRGKRHTIWSIGLVVLAIAVCVAVAVVIQQWYASSRAQHLVSMTHSDPRTITYYRLKDIARFDVPSFGLPASFLHAFDALGVTTVKEKAHASANLIMFETLNFIEEAVNKVTVTTPLKWIYGIGGTDLLASKSALFEVMRNALDADSLRVVLPKTYNVANSLDMENLREALATVAPGTLFIMKKNIQRQEGYHLTSDAEYVWQNRRDYVVVQEVLQDPYVLNGRKINMRVYLLVLVRGNQVGFYVYNNGFMYYTPKEFAKGSDDPQRHITTGYIDRRVYDENPLSHEDLRAYLGESKYSILRSNILATSNKLKAAYGDLFATRNASRPGAVHFCIFGMDIAPDERLGCKIIEVNKGPDLTYKDERDKRVKLSMLVDAFRLVGLSGLPVGAVRGGFDQV